MSVRRRSWPVIADTTRQNRASNQRSTVLGLDKNGENGRKRCASQIQNGIARPPQTPRLRGTIRVVTGNVPSDGGTYFLRANHEGGGAHVANCGYVTATWATGRGVARVMCAHSLEHAKALGFRAMQFNFVVSTNTAAVRAWERCGFAVVGRLPEAYRHRELGLVDALVMFRVL